MAKANTKPTQPAKRRPAKSKRRKAARPTLVGILDDPKLDPSLRAYGKGNADGRRKAELYLHELRLDPELIGMNIMGRYVDKIRPHPKNSRTSGQLVGFFSRIENEFARLVVDDIWRTTLWSQRWKIAKALTETYNTEDQSPTD